MSDSHGWEGGIDPGVWKQMKAAKKKEKKAAADKARRQQKLQDPESGFFHVADSDVSYARGKEPEQPGPSRRHGHAPSAAAQLAGTAAAQKKRDQQQLGEEDEWHDLLQEQEQEHAGKKKKKNLSEEERFQRQLDDWNKLAPLCRKEQLTHLPDVHAMKRKQQLSHMLMLQEQLDKQPACSCSHDSCMAEVVGKRSTIQFIGLRYTGELQIPVFRCGGCKKTASPSSFAVGCFPSTPISPHIWYDEEVFRMYQRLGPGAGLSAGGARMGEWVLEWVRACEASFLEASFRHP